MPDDDIVFLTLEQVKTLHRESIHRYSPTESTAIRDEGLLESAVMAPQHTWGGEYLYQSLPEMVAAYLISLNQNHAFENGNKRAAFAACSAFLRMNGYRLTLSEDQAVDVTLRIASHTIKREEVVAILLAAVQSL